jgi:hypothetical protein
MRYLALLAIAGAVAALAGCGSGHAPGAAAARAGAVVRARPLVFFQRNGGAAATLDAVTIRAGGATHFEKRFGGAGGRFDDFRLSMPMLARVRAALARVPTRVGAWGGAGLAGGATYILRYRGRSYAAREGAVPRALRPVVAALDDVLDGAGRAWRVRSPYQGPA